MLAARIDRLSEENDIVLVGPNGSGKSRLLRDLCLKKIGEGLEVIAISNTSFSRLPEISRVGYKHIRLNPRTTDEILKYLISSALESDSSAFASMREVLSYTGYRPILTLRVSRRSLRQRQQEPSAARDQDNTALFEASQKADSDEIDFLVEAVGNVVGEHVINLDSIYEFFRDNEVVARTVRNQREVNKVLRQRREKISVSFQFTKGNGAAVPVSSASSGELTLITLAMFILSRSKKLDYIFIDEPENSLHPQWQSSFLSFISNMSRRENVRHAIATHSPMLLTGALSDKDTVRVIRCKGDTTSELRRFRKNGDDSVEELLWFAFDVVTPASQFVSRRISDLLWKVEESKMIVDDALEEVYRFISKSISKDQKDFLLASADLIRDTSERLKSRNA